MANFEGGKTQATNLSRATVVRCWGTSCASANGGRRFLIPCWRRNRSKARIFDDEGQQEDFDWKRRWRRWSETSTSWYMKRRWDQTASRPNRQTSTTPTLYGFHSTLVGVWRSGEVTTCNDAEMKVCKNKADGLSFSNYIPISIVAHTGKNVMLR